MTWWVPVTQMVPLGLRTRWQRFSHSVLNSWFSSGPRLLSQVAFVHFDHLARVTGDAAVGEEVGRVGEHHVETAVGMFRSDGVEDLKTVALVEEDAVGVVAVDAIERRERAGFHDDAVEGIIGVGGDKAFGWGGVIDGADRMNGRDARSTRTDGRRDAYPTIFWFPRHRLIRSIGSGIGSRSISLSFWGGGGRGRDAMLKVDEVAGRA